MSSTHPFKDEEDEGKHHGSVGAVVWLLGLALVVGPRGPGSENHDRAPDEKNKLNNHPAPVRNFQDFVQLRIAAAYQQDSMEDCNVQSEGNIPK